jgi:membrane-bound lytic murein transglycosylase D
VDEVAVRRRMAELDARSPMEMTWNPVVHSRIAYFAERRRRHIADMTGRSTQYFPLFEEALDRYGLPLELKYLPIVESALNPNAVSPAGAQGLWQFMYGTARLQGLRIDSYLKQLFEMYGDWHLALSAYNAGPGNVNKALRRNGGKGNYWDIRPFLPGETQGYVPAFLAVVYMMESFDAHGITPSKPALAHALIDTVHVSTQVDLRRIARGIGMPEEEILALNPMYRLGVVPGGEASWPVRLPLALVPRYIAQESTWMTPEPVIEAVAVATSDPAPKPAPKKPSAIVYKVKPGDMLGSIARKHGVTVAQLTKWNGLKGTTIRPGQKLTIHVARGN